MIFGGTAKNHYNNIYSSVKWVHMVRPCSQVVVYHFILHVDNVIHVINYKLVSADIFPSKNLKC